MFLLTLQFFFVALLHASDALCCHFSYQVQLNEMLVVRYFNLIYLILIFDLFQIFKKKIQLVKVI